MRKLTESISVQELQQMRDEGLSNMQIAKRLDVSYATVRKYLGKADFRAPYGSCKKPEDVPEEKPVLLKKLMHIEEFLGEKNKYTVNIDSKTVTVKQLDNGTICCTGTTNFIHATYDKASLERHISELLDIPAMI